MDPIAEISKRLDKGESLRAVARSLGVSAPYLSDIMLGRRQPGPKVLAALGIERKIVTNVTYRRKRPPSEARKAS
jgi:transcriptional regulator with XRE-family HTH domain